MVPAAFAPRSRKSSPSTPTCRGMSPTRMRTKKPGPSELPRDDRTTEDQPRMSSMSIPLEADAVPELQVQQPPNAVGMVAIACAMLLKYLLHPCRVEQAAVQTP